MEGITAELAALAEFHGVASAYEDTAHRRHEVDATTVRSVLAALGVDATTPSAVAAALRAARDALAPGVAPPCVVIRHGVDATVPLQLPGGAGVDARLDLEDGGERVLADLGPPGRSAATGQERTERLLRVPAGLPTGYHRLTVRQRDLERATTTVIVAPATCPDPGTRPAWGFMTQLYALRSSRSWSIGDFADLKTLAGATGRAGGSFVLVNPLHAATPVPPLEPSPYAPGSRRFRDPQYLRVEDLPEFAAAPSRVRERVLRIAAAQQGRNRGDRIDRDAAWAAKRDALELLHGVPMDRQRAVAFAAWRAGRGPALEEFATFCALAEEHGSAWQRWPSALRHPSRPGVQAARARLAQRIDFHTWLQYCCDEQLAGVAEAAGDAGMSLGIVHDLAVAAGPGGADAWALQDDLALDITIGAPPDPFNQRGQDWGLPPLRPDRLAETSYTGFRDTLAGVLAHAGGIRIDHMMGLHRLWWVPAGAPPAAGTYVRYPARELLAVLALEAQRAGAVVIGEDLGTVPEPFREQLAQAGVLSSRVAYFERTEPSGRRLRSHEYPRSALATITTHDLPTPAAWWADEDIALHARLGLFAEDTTAEAERARKVAARGEMLALLRAEGLLADAADAADDPQRLVAALHAFLARTTSLLVAVSPADALGDRRQPNLPGTSDEYPNWLLPVAEPAPEGDRPVLLDDLLADPRLARLIRLLSEGRASAASRD